MNQSYRSLTPAQREEALRSAKEIYQAYVDKHLSLDLSRGKPSAEQLDLSDAMLSMPLTGEDCVSQDGSDCRNYGNWSGLSELRHLFSELTGVSADKIMIGGNSSLALMYDTISRAMIFGLGKSPRPWGREEKLKFVCPAPGYDRHFAITELFGFELLTVDMTDTGPDMDQVEALVRDDPAVKGIWCVPMYSNPTGVTYSDDTVRRLVRMPTAAPDFVIMWDNAYAIHDLDEKGDELLDVFAEAEQAGTEDRIFYYTSFSKVTWAGAAVAMMAMSDANLAVMKPIQAVRTIGYDKMNQLRHLLFLKDRETTLAHMKKHAAIIKRKFDILLEAMEEDLAGLDIATWTRPNGGYFVTLRCMDGCARRVYKLCRQAGVTLTAAGAVFPYGKDPHDAYLRLAPTYPSDEELAQAVRVLTASVRLASLEKLCADT